MIYEQPSDIGVVIFCTNLEIGKEPIDNQGYWEAYQDALLAIQAKGVNAYFATGNQTYAGNGRFTVAYALDRKVDSPQKLRRVYNVDVQVVLDRSESDPFQGTDCIVINPPAIRDIANNKLVTYQKLGKFQPRTKIVTSPHEMDRALGLLAGEQVVVKEPVNYGGKGVYIGTKADVRLQTINCAYPLLVQEFIDTSAGVPGIADCVYDVRIEVCGGQIISYQVRSAKPGSKYSNINQGGQKLFLNPQTIPGELESIVHKIDARFKGLPRYYSADFVKSLDGWKLLELNDYVGFNAVRLYNQYPSDPGQAAQKFDRLADYLINTAQNAMRELIPN